MGNDGVMIFVKDSKFACLDSQALREGVPLPASYRKINKLSQVAVIAGLEIKTGSKKGSKFDVVTWHIASGKAEKRVRMKQAALDFFNHEIGKRVAEFGRPVIIAGDSNTEPTTHSLVPGTEGYNFTGSNPGLVDITKGTLDKDSFLYDHFLTKFNGHDMLANPKALGPNYWEHEQNNGSTKHRMSGTQLDKLGRDMTCIDNFFGTHDVAVQGCTKFPERKFNHDHTDHLFPNYQQVSDHLPRTVWFTLVTDTEGDATTNTFWYILSFLVIAFGALLVVVGILLNLAHLHRLRDENIIIRALEQDRRRSSQSKKPKVSL